MTPWLSEPSPRGPGWELKDLLQRRQVSTAREAPWVTGRCSQWGDLHGLYLTRDYEGGISGCSEGAGPFLPSPLASGALSGDVPPAMVRAGFS